MDIISVTSRFSGMVVEHCCWLLKKKFFSRFRKRRMGIPFLPMQTGMCYFPCFLQDNSYRASSVSWWIFPLFMYSPEHFRECCNQSRLTDSGSLAFDEWPSDDIEKDQQGQPFISYGFCHYHIWMHWRRQRLRSIRIYIFLYQRLDIFDVAVSTFVCEWLVIVYFLFRPFLITVGIIL